MSECPNRPEWAEPNTPAISPEGFCFHCSRIRGEWVSCEGNAECGWCHTCRAGAAVSTERETRPAEHPYVQELEARLRLACEPCAECGHVDWRELDDCLPALPAVLREPEQ